MISNFSLAFLLTLLSLPPYLPTANADTTSSSTSSFPPGVLASGTMDPNSPQPTSNTPINQTSMARLLSINSIDDFCLFAPPNPENISDSEAYEVAWCTKPRNNARVIPDGVLFGASFLKTDFYVQLIGYGDLTQLNIPYGDSGGELDPHGANGYGNPVGGSVTTNISGTDRFYAEWMSYIDDNQFCLRVCTNANSTYSAAEMCWHELDVMGCEFALPGNYNVNNTFETCDADVAYPPGWYPTVVNGTTSFSKFAQRYTGTLSNGSLYTIGDTSTPSLPYTIPKSSNCETTSTISNGIPLAMLVGSSSKAVSPRLYPTSTDGFIRSGGGNSGGNSGDGQSSSARKYDGGLEIVIVASWAVLAGIGGVVLLA